MEIFDNLAHQIVLLAINPYTSELRNSYKLRTLTSAATLAELALQERVRLVGEKVEVQDSRPTGDPSVDIMLDDLSHRPPRAPIRIIADPKDAYLNQALTELMANRRIRITPAYGVNSTKYEIVDAKTVAAAKAQASQGLHDPLGCPARQGYLAALATQLRLVGEICDDLPLRQRMKLKAQFEERFWLIHDACEVFRLSAKTQRIS